MYKIRFFNWRIYSQVFTIFRRINHTSVDTPQLVRNSTALSVATATPSKRRYIRDSADLEAVKNTKREEIELRDRTTVLRGTKPNNFASIKGIIEECPKKLRDSTKPRSSMASQPPRPAMSFQPDFQPCRPSFYHIFLDSKMFAKKARNNFLIVDIIISSSPTALITMHNVKRFLQESLFELSAEARARAAAEGNS